MDITLGVKMAEYYEKLIDLQDKLRRSEEERLKLEMKFSEIIQVTREEEQLHYRKLRHQYKIFLEEDRIRQERNERIVKTLEKIDARISRLASKTEHHLRPRRFCSNCHHRTCQVTKFSNSNEKTEPRFPKYEQEYEKETTDIEKYLESLKKTSSSTKQNEFQLIRTNELDNLKEGLNRRFDSNKANSIATEIMNSIYSRHYERDVLDSKIPDISQPIPKIVGTESAKPKFDNTSLPSPVSSIKYNERSLPGEAPDFLPEIPPRKVYDSKNMPIPTTQYNPTNGPNSPVHVHETYEEIEKNDISEPDGLLQENSLPKEEEKITQELSCPMKEDDLIKQASDENNTNLIENYIENTPPEQLTKSKRNTDEARPNIQDWPAEKSTKINPEKSDRVSKPIIEDESFPEELQNGTKIEQSDALCQQIQNDPQTAIADQIAEDDNLIPPSTPQVDGQGVQHVEHHEPQFAEHAPEDDNQLVNQYEAQYDENGQVIGHQYDQTDQHYDPQYDEQGQLIQQQQFSSNQYEPQYDENGQLIGQYDGTGQQGQYDKNGQLIGQYNETGQQGQYDENGQLIGQYDETGQQGQYDKNGQLIGQYNETGQQGQYDENGQLIGQYDETGQQGQYDENGQLIGQYDETGQQEQYDKNGQLIGQYNETGQQGHQYDENGQLIGQYDETGQQGQYDENGQLIGQYDETGQQGQYDENGQARQLYDENGRAIQYDGQSYPAFEGDPNLHYGQYDEHGQLYDQQYHDNQPSVQQYNDYDQAYGQYDEKGPVLGDNEQQPYEEKVDLNSTEANAGGQEQPESNEISHGPKETGEDVEVRNNKVMDMLDTDTESLKQTTSKISNESDFDFGSG